MTLIFVWFLEGCAAFGLVGSYGQCTFLEMHECTQRALEIQQEQNLKDAPLCFWDALEVWEG